jgi:predicted MFS family arabinose efflux permease
MFLPVYYIRLGLGISDIAALLLITFMIIGFLPTILLRFIRNFERIICFGVLSTMAFYMLLLYVKNPILLGVAYGLGIATFWPSFNLLQFRLSESNIRARSVSLFSLIIPSIASIAGPAAGGLIIENFGFPALLLLAIVLYFISLIFFMQVKFRKRPIGYLFQEGVNFPFSFQPSWFLGLWRLIGLHIPSLLAEFRRLFPEWVLS